MTSSSEVAETSPWRHGFWSLMATQFQGAFSDNVLKQLVIFLVMAQNLPNDQIEALVSHAGIYFAVPFLLLSMMGGWMADRFSKRSVMMGVKIAEIGIMVFATLALWNGHLDFQLIAICLMGVHSAFFAASKYGCLPEVVPAPQLSWANGVLEMLTFMAAILGTLFAGWLAMNYSTDPKKAGYILMGLALAGFIASTGITRMQAQNPAKKLKANFIGELWREFSYMRTDRDLWRANLGNTAFFFIAALVQMNLLLYAREVLHLDPQRNSFLNAALAVGIGLGSVAAGYLSRGRISYGLVVIGAWLLAIMGGVLGVPGISLAIFTIALALLGVGGGFFIVPLAAVLQHRPSAERKGAVQGAASWLSWVGICAASILQGQLGKAGWSPGQIFWVCAVCSAVAGIYIARSRPGAVRALFQRSGDF